jgi:hypothetical protein
MSPPYRFCGHADSNMIHRLLGGEHFPTSTLVLYCLQYLQHRDRNRPRVGPSRDEPNREGSTGGLTTKPPDWEVLIDFSCWLLATSSQPGLVCCLGRRASCGSSPGWSGILALVGEPSVRKRTVRHWPGMHRVNAPAVPYALLLVRPSACALSHASGAQGMPSGYVVFESAGSWRL